MLRLEFRFARLFLPVFLLAFSVSAMIMTPAPGMAAETSQRAARAIDKAYAYAYRSCARAAAYRRRVIKLRKKCIEKGMSAEMNICWPAPPIMRRNACVRTRRNFTACS